MSKIIWLSDTDQNVIYEESSRSFPLETGGVLMGYWARNNIVITNVIGPGPNAIHLPSSFLPDHDWQLEEISKIYLFSERIFTYLGDWHSHPTGGLYLSWRDRRTLNKIAHSPSARAPFPLMLVVSGKDNEWKTGAWLLTGKSLFKWQFGKVTDVLVHEFPEPVRAPLSNSKDFQAPSHPLR